MLYYSHPAHVIIHQPATIQRSLTLDDYLQLQMLLRHEQAERERRMRQHHHLHHHQHGVPHTHAVFPSEQLRIQRALENLKQLKENYRRERAQRIQRYMDHYRRQALVAAAAAQEEYYRQCLAAAIEQQRAQDLWQQYQTARRDSIQQQQQQSSEEEEEEEEQEEVEVSSDEDPDYEDYRAERLAALLKILFGQPAHQDHEMALESEHEQENSNEDQEAEALWRYINEQQQQQQEDNDDEEEEDNNAYMTWVSGRTEEQPQQPKSRAAGGGGGSSGQQQEVVTDQEQQQLPPLQSRVLNLKDLLDQLVSGVPHEEADEPKPSGMWAAANEPVKDQPAVATAKDDGLWGRNESTARPSLEAEPPAPRIVDELLSQASTTRSNERKEQVPPASGREHQLPTRSAPTAGGGGGVWDKNEGTAIPSETAQPPPPQTTEHVLEQQKQEEESPVFAPKQVVTPAEPQHSSPPPPDPHAAEKEAERVDRIAEQQKQNLPSTAEDPVKVEKRKQLDKIRQQLRDIQQEREPAILVSPLQFTKNEQGTLNLTANTPNNRAFLGYEDEIMRAMLKLDTIESEGDDDIRNERKSLVKQAESMLERLDEHKQKEWEKVRKRTNKNRQRRHKKKKNKKYYQNFQKEPVAAYA